MSRQFDAIVIGSGLGGLTAGALHAQAGHRVLVLERNQYFGGAATVYQRGALAVEWLLHRTPGVTFVTMFQRQSRSDCGSH